MSDVKYLAGMDGGMPLAGRVELAWAGRAFIEPVIGEARIMPLRGDHRVEPEQEFAFYNDWQTRDSELGLALLNERKFDLLRSTSLLRNGLQRRLRNLSV